MFLVGLTGGIASGKSTVSSQLRELGCPVIDADVVARKVVEPHTAAYRLVVRHFGQEVLLENGEIDRQKLGNIIFSSPEKRRLLNSITHPEIHRAMLKQILLYFIRGYRYVILDVPLLFETRRLARFLNHTVVVYCDPATQLARLMHRDGLSQEEAERRVAAQMPLNEKRGLASHVIENSGSREDTHRQVLKLHTKLEDSMEFLIARAVAVAAAAGLGGLLLNSLLADLPLRAIRPLQLIQNPAAARLVFNLPKFSHVTPLLRSLHWLPVAAPASDSKL